MSASLVGSEMCIRDRREALRGGSGRRPPGGASQGCAGNCPGLPDRPGRCLLYTSDAADDM
eukprot:10084772-Alexandrium_andersonii.AAC.1